MMKSLPDLAAVAALIADPSRATMLHALLDGVALPAGELARRARITPQTASTHLDKLVKGGLLTVNASGRHRYYRLSSKQVAQTLEALALIAPAQPVRSLNRSLEMQAICRARTCYDHLAGALGVALTDALVGREILLPHEEVYEVTGSGECWFHAFGIDCSQLQQKRRRFASACLDWSERRPHVAGALGAAIAQRLFALGWIGRVEGSRAVTLSELGRRGLQQELDLELA